MSDIMFTSPMEEKLCVIILPSTETQQSICTYVLWCCLQRDTEDVKNKGREQQ